MSDRPIVLEAIPVDGGVSIRVLGRSAVAVEVGFALEVRAGTNRSTHRGTAMLAPREQAVLTSITASTDADSWGATLDVEVAGGKAYRQVARSS